MPQGRHYQGFQRGDLQGGRILTVGFAGMSRAKPWARALWTLQREFCPRAEVCEPEAQARANDDDPRLRFGLLSGVGRGYQGRQSLVS